MRHRWVRIAAIFGLLAILSTSAGCLPWLGIDDGAAFVAGWTARGVLDGLQPPQCFRNGEAIACSDLPAEYAPQ